MFVSTLSTMDGFKLTTSNGEEIVINLIRTAGVNTATIGIDCDRSIDIKKIESTITVLERVKRDLIQEIDRLTMDYNNVMRNKAIDRSKNHKRKFNKQPDNYTKQFPSDDIESKKLPIYGRD